MKLKPQAKVIVFLLLAVVGFFGIKWYQKKPKEVGNALQLGKVSIPDEPTASLVGNAAVKLPLPSTKTSTKGDLLDIEWQMMAWQSQNGALYANGGSETTEGSLFEAAGLNVKIKRQDDCLQSEAEFINYLKDYKDGKRKDGMFVTYMASGIDNYINAIKEKTKDLGAEYGPVVFLTFGKSYGEDQVIGDIKYKENKQLLKGAVVRGVKEDGDIDLILKLAFDNNINVNPDPALYYSDALNLSYSKDYLSAVEDYNKGLKETRKIVLNGKTTGKDTSVGYDLVATWTPGDVNAKNGRGGVTIISTGVYKSVMPNITIASKKFVNTNRDKMVNLTLALAQAGDQIRTFKEAKEYACAIGSKVWNENTPQYWGKYYDGVQVDKDTYLGGSMVFNLNDMGNVFGLNGNRDIFKDIYNTFSGIHSKLYPEDYKTIADYSSIVDKSILRSAIDQEKDKTGSTLLDGKALVTDYSKSTGEVVGTKNWSIEFNSGSATVSSVSYNLLEQIAQEINSSEGLSVTVYGHTDNTGSDEQNIPLSKQRAQAIVDYLVSKGITEARFVEVKGFGSTQPIASNSDVVGKKKNRRVQIILKQ